MRPAGFTRDAKVFGVMLTLSIVPLTRLYFINIAFKNRFLDEVPIYAARYKTIPKNAASHQILLSMRPPSSLRPLH